ncbi:MAG: diacylglycerol kinase family protein [Deferrisomatales bacterium]
MPRRPERRPPPGTRPRRVGLLTNPRSGGNRRGLGRLHALLAAHPEVVHRQAVTPEQIASALRNLAEEEVEVLAVNGGDGTIQAALTALFEERPFPRLPLLALPLAGTTSMTARDVGLGGSRLEALARLFSWAGGKPVQAATVRRPVLRVRAYPEAAPVYGMFFGIGAVYQGVEYFHRRIYGLGLRGELSSGLAILRCLWAFARGGGGLLRPAEVSLSVDGEPDRPGRYLLALVSSLERLLVGLRPYFGSGPGPLHFTAVSARPRHFVGALPALTCGRPTRWATPANGYVSRLVGEVRLALDSGFVVDGERFPTDPKKGPVVVDKGGDAAFLRLYG